MIEDHDTTMGLVQRHEMGQAYKAITAKMGPSPQLVAFVNYDRVTEDSLGLESFNIMDQHQQILTEIDEDRSLSMALESVQSHATKVSGKLIAAAGAGAMAAGFVGFGAVSLGFAIASIGAITYTVGREMEKVPPYSNFEKHQKEFDATVKLLQSFESSMPSTLNGASWQAFLTKFAKELNPKSPITSPAELLKFVFTNKHSAHGLVKNYEPETPLKSSGWTPGTLKSAMIWLDKSNKSLVDTNKKIADKIARVKSMLGNTKPDKDVIKIMSKAITTVHKLSETNHQSLEKACKDIKSVSKHFDVEKK